MSSQFIATRGGVPFGEYVCTDADGWRWASGTGEQGPLLMNRAMDVYRRPGFLGQLGLLPDATWAQELSRTWGIRANDAVELVPVPVAGEPVFIPVGSRSSAPVGTVVMLTAEGAFLEEHQIGRVPRSFPVLLERLGITGGLSGFVVATPTGKFIVRVP